MNLPTNVEYDSDQTSAMAALYNKNKTNNAGNSSQLARFLVRNGIVKNKKVAAYFLIGIAIFCVALAIFVIINASKQPIIYPVSTLLVQK